VPLKAIVPENNTSYVLYYLPCTFEWSKGKYEPTNMELFSVLQDYESKMSLGVILVVTYLDGDGEEIHTQLIRLGALFPTVYRKFYFTGRSEEIGRASQVFAVAPGYVGDGCKHLFLGSSNYNQKYDAGWYIELDESDLQRLDSMKLEVVFESQ
jgi:hypothetical protein